MPMKDLRISYIDEKCTMMQYNLGFTTGHMHMQVEGRKLKDILYTQLCIQYHDLILYRTHFQPCPIPK